MLLPCRESAVGRALLAADLIWRLCERGVGLKASVMRQLSLEDP